LGRREWIAAFKKVCETDHQFTAVICKTTTCGFTIRDFGSFAWDKALLAVGFDGRGDEKLPLAAA
jgi:hypothetical protein